MGGRGSSASSPTGGGSRASQLSSMSKEERRSFLSDAPVGTTIDGVYDKRTGEPVKVEKVEYYAESTHPQATSRRTRRTEWQVDGHGPGPYLSVQDVLAGKNRYYGVR